MQTNFKARGFPPSRGALLASIVLGLSFGLSSCDSDKKTAPDNNGQGGGGGGSSNHNTSLTLQTGGFTTAPLQIREGAGAVSVPLTIDRGNSQSGTITLTVSADNNQQLDLQISPSSLGPNDTEANLTINMGIGPRPILSDSRVLQLSASDGQSAALTATLHLTIQPTDRPDVYLLVGQSNMVGFSEDNSKQAAAGQADAPDERIFQLNVTGNDEVNFAVPSDFTNNAKLFNQGEALTPAVDPLHDGYDSNQNGKSGQRIGLGLSFAKRALADTTADIYLVPTAWSDTGFCKRDTNRVAGIGWNATLKSNDALSGTLLHDRAIARANIALNETGGILRGILWHQGEADSENAACAQSYAANLTELAQSLRSNIAQDARGVSARGANSDLPFIAGTMSKGNDQQSSQTPFSADKLLVDAAHRNIGSQLNFAGFVNNDDLVPSAFPCGEGSCIHFGSLAYREMGSRYYDALNAVLP